MRGTNNLSTIVAGLGAAIASTHNVADMVEQHAKELEQVAIAFSMSVEEVVRELQRIAQLQEEYDCMLYCLPAKLEDNLLVDDWAWQARKELMQYAHSKQAVYSKAKRGYASKPHTKGIYWHRVRSFCVRSNYH